MCNGFVSCAVPSAKAIRTAMPEEVEIKLRLSPDRASRLRRSVLLHSLTRGRGRTRRLTSVYFDTPRQDLRAAGTALRIRHLGQRRIQTIKLPTEAPTGLQTFREIESDIGGDVPDLTRFQGEEKDA